MRAVASTSDPCRAITVRITPPNARALIVYGTVLPWLGSSWQGVPAAGGLAFSAALSAQCADWLSLQRENLDCEFILAGDFNQDLSSAHYYGSKQNRAVLQNAITTAKLQCLSAAALDPVPKHAPSHASIDYICVSAGLTLLGTPLSWPFLEQPQKNLSDHFGVFVEVTDT